MQTMHAVVSKKLKLNAYQIIIAESEEYLLEEALLRMKSRQRPRENKKQRTELGEFSFGGFRVKRTFLCEASLLCDAKSVAQSTTEVVVGASSSSYFAHFRGTT